MKTSKRLRERLQAIDEWETEARRIWLEDGRPPTDESPRNFEAGFVGTWSDASGMLATDMTQGAIYRILQSPRGAWQLVMKRCIAAGLDPRMVREWLDQSEGRHYADALICAVLGSEIDAFELQTRSITEAFETDPRVDPVLCISEDPDSASAAARRTISRVASTLTHGPRQVH